MADNIIFDASLFALKQVCKQIADNRKAKKAAKRKYCKSN